MINYIPDCFLETYERSEISQVCHPVYIPGRSPSTTNVSKTSTSVREKFPITSFAPMFALRLVFRGCNGDD